MANKNPEELRNALIVAGLHEIETHGVKDFSVRRIAGSCGVSCATPYCYFEDKNDFIGAIISYVQQQWSLLQKHIESTYEGDVVRQLVEISVANIRFWTANSVYMSIMLLDDGEFDRAQLLERSKITDDTMALIDAYCARFRIDDHERNKRIFLVRSVIYGAVNMIRSGQLQNGPDVADMVRECLYDIIGRPNGTA